MIAATSMTMAKNNPGTSNAAPTTVSAPTLHPTLVPELLGFSPQMLLDDIISAAADAILQCLQAMEPFMQRWADARTDTNNNNTKQQKKGNAANDDEWDGLEAVEQGLVAFQTLLEAHTDIAFDFFEAWSLRNIFALPAELPIVAPHQRGLDLDPRPEEEGELMADIEELRRRIENQRRLRRMYQKAVRISRVGRARSEKRLTRLAYLAPPSPSSSTTPADPNTTSSALDSLHALPPIATSLFDAAAALPHLETLAALLPTPASTASSSTSNAANANGDGAGTGPSGTRRPWETSAQGYTAWAVAQLLAKAREQASTATSKMSSTGDAAAAQASAVAPSVLEVVGLLDEVRAVEAEAVVNAKKRLDVAMEGAEEEEKENMTMDTS